MIYPSLFEGFGMPVIEAMAESVPVLCSNNSSLPEIGGDAALYFDAKKPNEICDAIVRLCIEENLHHNLAEKSLLQAQKFLNHERMVEAYWTAFENLIDKQKNELVKI
jgi:glycosyltransferase involved in cell wall biosynthesis